MFCYRRQLMVRLFEIFESSLCPLRNTTLAELRVKIQSPSGTFLPIFITWEGLV